ncbi:serine hydrolase [candidate division WWE3 bacterium]|jgi:beta-lactamase class A|uniref:Serine hydrolase n=1 Tax=candidate division WWE3 bacterium TaxID=2053526 RepID=A0A3A4ZB65_UNCKA|nr:MAG: serine hydrolase [candidate division WWE3 bacterium]
MIKWTRRRDKKYLKIDRIVPLLILISVVSVLLLARSLFLESSDVLSFSTIGFSVFEKFLSGNRIDKDKEFEALKKVLEQQGTKYSLYIEDLATGKTYAYNAQERTYAASMYKVPVAAAVLKSIQDRNLSFTTELIYAQSDYADGTGVINRNQFGTKFSVEQLLTHLLDDSDNTAQNMLLRKVSKAQVGTLISQNIDNPSQSIFAAENTATATEMATFLKNMYKKDVLTQENKNFLFNEMKQTAFDDRITQHLKPELSFAHKIGNWGDTGSWHDCGIVFGSNDKYVVCVMSRGTTFENFLEVGKSTADFLNKIVQ